MIDQSKRRILVATMAAAAGGALGIALRPGPARAQAAPGVDETLSILSSATDLEILIRRYDLIWSIAVNIILQDDSGINKGGFLKTVVKDRRSLHQLLFKLRDAATRKTFVAQIKKNGKQRKTMDGVSSLVANLSLAMDRAGINPAKPMLKSAVASLYHLERIAIAGDGTSSQGPYVCRFFPFSFFCK